MDSLDIMMGKLSEEAAQGISRRRFLKLLFAVGGAFILTNLGLETAKAIAPNLVPDAPCAAGHFCSIPCDSRLFCLQRAEHHHGNDCNQPDPTKREPCPTNPCPGNPDQQYCKQSCKRCCQPINCSCGSWTVTKSCVSCPAGNDRCLGCSGSCPASSSQQPKP